MSRFKLVVLLCVLVITLLWPMSVAADTPDPSKCLPNCYAKNGIAATGDGTVEKPWKAETDQERIDLRKAAAKAVQDDGDPGSLTIVICDNAGKCTKTLYEYTAKADANAVEAAEVAGQQLPGDPTQNGVPLPVPYLLASGALVGVLLVSSGLVLRRRALRWSA